MTERAKRDLETPKAGASVSMGRKNYDWCTQEAAKEMVSFSRFVDELITCRRMQIEKERANALVIDRRTSH